MSGIDYDKLAGEYSHHRGAHPEVLRALAELIEQEKPHRVLELGCGTGNYLEKLQPIDGTSLSGIDPSRGMLRSAQQRAPGAWLAQGSSETLPFACGTFQFAFSVDVIHHVRSPGMHFQEMSRVLEEGGLGCTVTDSAEIIASRLPLSNYFPETVAADLARYPSIPYLVSQMKVAGILPYAQLQVELSYTAHDINIYEARAFSCLHLISDGAFQRGLDRLRADLARGPIQCRTRYVILLGRNRQKSER